MKKNIALVFGSMDSEHEVSIASAQSVYENFPFESYNCHILYISKQGEWFTGEYDFANQAFTSKQKLMLRFDLKEPGFYEIESQSNLKIDAAFLMLHGKTGEGGYVQGLLSLAHIPFTGCDLLSSSLCMDKVYTHEICESHQIPMAAYQHLKQGEKAQDVSYPCIVKPSREGSSFGVSYVANESELQAALDEAFKFDDKVLIEAYIDGVEVGLAILDTHGERIISDVDQVNVSGNFFDFKEKYHPHNTETLPYAQFPQTVLEQVQTYGSQIFDLLSCSQFARLDFFITNDHQIYFNEVNTIPGFTQNSRYPQMMARAGVDFKTLINRLIEDVL